MGSMTYQTFATVVNRLGFKLVHHSTACLGLPDGESVEGFRIERVLDGANGQPDDEGVLYINGVKSSAVELQEYLRGVVRCP